MARNSFWKGYLKLSLVTCPVTMQPAVSDRERVRFHTINQKTGHRIQRRYVDSVTGKPVREEDEARGYPRGEGDYVVLEDEDLEAVALDSTRTIDIHEFVPEGRIGWIWYDRPHFMIPDGTVGEEAFSVIREAMRATGTVGVARLVLYRRERAVMLVPRGKGIVLWTLRYGDEVRDPEDHFSHLRKETAEAATLKLVTRLIDTRTVQWDSRMVEDPVQDNLLELIEAKRSKRKPPAKSRDDAPADSGNVVNIMDALKRSIAAESRRKH